MRPEAIACIVLAACTAACIAALITVALERRSGSAGRPQTIVRTYIIHGRHRGDRAANVARLAHFAAPITQHGNVAVWPATFTRQDAAVQRQYDACPGDDSRVKPGEFGCTLSHVAALQHALQSAPEIAAPNTSSWVLVFEDDAELHRAVELRAAHALMASALATAAANGADTVFFGWAYKTEPRVQRRVHARLWIASAPLQAHAYAVRGALLPALLVTLKQHVCRTPVDVVFRRSLFEAVVVAPKPYTRLPLGLDGHGLFVQADGASDTYPA